ncbi:DegT/DnrJ/EryC1/StrS aminotransferase family protein [Candidatus Dojkabacteria bacterium]|nr:DegT/DnrJ/EryC1/StrS aminotransferase family protein [Candidatus Dojkabacteria bacterium]
MVIYEPRASAILYNFLKTYDTSKTFILPANICPIVPLTLLKASKKFEFIDITLHDYCLDREKVLYVINKHPQKYAGIIFVHTYGAIQDTENFYEDIKRINKEILIIDDRCLCIPETNYDYKESSQDLTIFSTGYAKYVDFGYGGFGFLNKKIKYHKFHLDYDEEDLLRITKQYKKCIKDKERFIYKDNNWLDNTKFKFSKAEYFQRIKNGIGEASRVKKEINKIYREKLPQSIFLPGKFQNWRFNILIPNKEKIIKEIFNAGLFASSHYNSLVPLFFNSEAEKASYLQKRIINLFNDKYFSSDKAKKICKIINKYII